MVAAKSGDAHLGHGLEDALFDGGDVVVCQLAQPHLPRQVAPTSEVLHGLERQVGVDGVGAVAAQQAEVHHLAGLAAFDDQSGLASQASLEESMMDRPHRQQRRDGGVVLLGIAVRDNQQRRAVSHCHGCLVDKLVEPALQRITRLIVPGVEQGVDGGYAEVVAVALSQAKHILVAQYGVRQLEHAAVFGRLGEQVARPARV